MINPYPANMENMVAPTNASKWRMGFNSAFKGLKQINNYLESQDLSMAVIRAKDISRFVYHITLSVSYRVWVSGHFYTIGFLETFIVVTRSIRYMYIINTTYFY